jgi:diguanylate cyclase (GGDEF)-like protein/PAS domain S-box-containing protein
LSQLPNSVKQRTGILVLVLLVAVGLGMLVLEWHRERERALQAGMVSVDTFARSFEEHLTKTLHLVELVFSTLEHAPDSGEARFEAVARVALRSAPHLRSLSLLDAQGRVMASTDPANVGSSFAVGSAYPAVEPQMTLLRIGAVQVGRDIAGAAAAGPGRPGPTDGPSVVPVLRRLPPVTGSNAGWILAAVNPEHFVQHHSLMLDPREGHVQWLRYDGLLLTSSGLHDLPWSVGQSGDVMRRLAQQEFGRFEQTLSDGRDVLSAYRASSGYPALIAVHLYRTRVLAAADAQTRALAVIVLPVLAALAALGALALYRQGQLVQREFELLRQLRLSASVFDASGDAIVLTLPSGRVINCNQAFLRLTGLAREQVTGHSHRHIVCGMQGRRAYRRMLVHLLREDSWQGELVNRRADGSPYTVLATVNAVRDEQGRVQHYVGVFRDITERKRAEAAEREAHLLLGQLATEQRLLRELAIRDPLTGLYNRRYLDETLPRELARIKRDGRPLALVMIDIDHFKAINDRFGHPAGDQVIRCVARTLAGGTREGDVVCRYGGEEFLVVMPGMGAPAALARAERWRSLVASQCVLVDDHEIRCTISAGVAALPEQADAAEALLKCADSALYRAKRDGRDRVCLFRPIQSESEPSALSDLPA